MTYTQGDIYYLWVEYDEPDENGEIGKHRPVILLQFDYELEIAAYAQVTSEPPPSIARQPYHYKSYIQDWNKCGLNEPSFIQLHESTMKACDFCDLTTKYGILTERDFNAFNGRAKILKGNLKEMKSYYIDIT